MIIYLEVPNGLAMCVSFVRYTYVVGVNQGKLKAIAH